MLKQEKPKGEMFMRGFFRRLLADFAWLPLLVAQPALAQDYPLRPIRVIVTTSPGGISDILCARWANGCISGSASPW
jgi:hypothetical protein